MTCKTYSEIVRNNLKKFSSFKNSNYFNASQCILTRIDMRPKQKDLASFNDIFELIDFLFYFSIESWSG